MSIKLTVEVPLAAVTALRDATDTQDVLNTLSRSSPSAVVVGEFAKALIDAVKALRYDEAAFGNCTNSMDHEVKDGTAELVDMVERASIKDVTAYRHLTFCVGELTFCAGGSRPEIYFKVRPTLKFSMVVSSYGTQQDVDINNLLWTLPSGRDVTQDEMLKGTIGELEIRDGDVLGVREAS